MTSTGPASWIDWRTGVTRTDDGTWSETTDLDAAALVKPLCAPLHRPLASPGASYRFGRYGYDGRYGVGTDWQRVPLTIQGCGAAEPTVLDSSITIDPMAQLGSGEVTWVAGNGAGVSAYLPRCDARLSWKDGATAIAHTASSVYVIKIDGGRTFALDRLDLPAGCGGGLTRALTVRAGGKQADVRASAGAWTSARLGGAHVDVLRVLPRPRPRVALTRGRSVALRTDAPARSVRWRIDQGGWHAARPAGRDRTRWSIAAPRLPNPATLSVAAAYATDGKGGASSASFTLHARAAGR
ncbi:MAG: hypothetical protein JWQ48_3214 [Conexibacter sp.]|nr:hypothetical protein [Conexibacter sp.]